MWWWHQGSIQRQGTQATNRPTHTILTELSLRVEIPSRLGHHLIRWKSIKSNHTSIKLAQSMFPNGCDRWPPWYLGFEKIRREVGENRVSGPVGCLCPLSLYTPLVWAYTYSHMYVHITINVRMLARVQWKAYMYVRTYVSTTVLIYIRS